MVEFEGILVVCVVVFLVLSFWLYARKKAAWKNPRESFCPFTWQIEGRRPKQVSRRPARYVPTDAQINAAERRLDTLTTEVPSQRGSSQDK